MSVKPNLTTSASPIAVLITADDGGVGKTTLAVQIATAFKLAERALDLFQLDSKGKLAAKTGAAVTSLSVADQQGARGDDLNPADVIAPWYRSITAMDASSHSTLLEVGGANAALFHAGVAEIDVQEDIETLGIEFVAFVVTKAGEDSAVQTLREVKRLKTNLPGARIVVVRNEVMGCPVAATEYLEDRMKKAYRALIESHESIRLPRVRPRSMAMYERLHVTPDVVVSWHADGYAEAIRRTGRPRDEAKIFVKDIAAWSGVVQEDLLRALPMLGGDADG
jgi:hypothetical protein